MSSNNYEHIRNYDSWVVLSMINFTYIIRSGHIEMLDLYYR